MIEKFFPNRHCTSTYDIDYNEYYKRGFRGIIFDIDNTLVGHNADIDNRVRELLLNLEEIGFKVCLLSNNGEKRVARFCKDIKIDYIFHANKPFKKKYYMAMDRINTDIRNTFFVGDQIFTDIYGANRVGLYSILVNPIFPKEEIQIIIKRWPERIVLGRYKKYLLKNGLTEI